MNGVHETTMTAGTGALTVAAVAGRQRIRDSVPVGLQCGYRLVDANGDEEYGFGRRLADETFSRDFVTESFVSGVVSFANTKISLSGSGADLRLTAIAEDVPAGLPFVSGSYRKSVRSPHFTSDDSTTIGVTANRLYAIPRRVDSAYSLAGYHVDMNTAGAASTIMCLGTAAMNYDASIGTIMAEVDGIDTSVTATVLAPNLASSVRLPRGWYYDLMLCSGTPTFTAYPAAVGGLAPIGADDAASSCRDIVLLYEAISAGWSVLPTSHGAMSKLTAGASAFPCIRHRIG